VFSLCGCGCVCTGAWSRYILDATVAQLTLPKSRLEHSWFKNWVEEPLEGSSSDAHSNVSYQNSSSYLFPPKNPKNTPGAGQNHLANHGRGYHHHRNDGCCHHLCGVFFYT
jgi:hypothetical protein